VKLLEILDATPGLIRVSGPQATDRESLKSFIRNDAYSTSAHQMSTCRMSSSPSEGVVNAQLKVHGLSNVRVADLSVLRRPVRGHSTASTSLLIGEKAAEMIKQAQGL
jgi:choline dehydrogenase